MDEESMTYVYLLMLVMKFQNEKNKMREEKDWREAVANSCRVLSSFRVFGDSRETFR